jgi:hypothetical protein
MPNPFLSARISVELHQQIEEFLARTGETKTEMLAKAVAAYIGVQAPPLKVTGDRRIENVELEVAELKGALQSLYEMFATFTSKIENPKVELEPISTYDNIADNNDNKTNNSVPVEDIDKIDPTLSNIKNTVDSNDNYIEDEKANTPDNNFDNNDNIAETIQAIDIKPTSNNEKTFIHIDTTEVARRTKLEPKTINNLWTSFKRKLKRENQDFPQKKILDSPIKMTPSSEVKIEKVRYDVFYVGQSQEGRNLWNLVPENTPGEQISLTFPTDNA